MSLKRALERFEKTLCRENSRASKKEATDNTAEHLKTGAEGEQFAVDYLADNGYRLLARNVRYPFGEIDIIAKDGDDIVFVEVRTRRIGYLLPADRTVGPDKLKKLLRAAKMWVEEKNYDGFWRIDLIAITIDACGNRSAEHIKEITEGIQ